MDATTDQDVQAKMAELKTHPGMAHIHIPAEELTSEQQEQIDDLYQQLNGIVSYTVDLTPEDYDGGEEDAVAVKQMFSGEQPIDTYFNHERPAVRAIAIIRSALTIHFLPINQRCADWPRWVTRYKMIINLV